MKPLVLKMSAFGPYSGSVTIDFNDLQGQKLFLIHGPTGAGKTTILDAMVYALYGQSSGGQRDGSDMRSDYAQPTQETMISYSFVIGEDIYRIDRKPKQEIKKIRGEGTKTVQPEAKLFRLQNEEWELVTDRSAEIKTKVREIIGFDAAQFLQVVLLPQGDFRKLLLANTTDREKIMNTLFRTDIYNRFQKRIGDEAEYIFAQCETSQREQERLLNGEEVATIDDLKEKIIVGKKQSELLEAEHKSTKTEDTVIQQRLQVKQRRNEGMANLCKLQEQLHSMDRQVPVIEKQRILAAQLQKAETLAPLHKHFVDANVAFDSTEKTIAEQKKTLHTAELIKSDLAKQRIVLGGRRTQYDEDVINIARYEEWLKLLDSLGRLKQEFQSVEAKLADSSGQEAKIVAELSAKLEELQRLEITIANNEENSKKLTQIAMQKITWDTMLEAHKDREKRQDRLDADKVKIEEEERTAEMLREAAESSYRIYLNAERQYDAAKLFHAGQKLQEGDPCPVCGARNHPQLAVAPEETVNEEDVTSAKKTWEIQQKQSSDASGVVAALRRNWEEAKLALAEIMAEEYIPKEAVLENRMAAIQAETEGEALGIETEKLKRLRKSCATDAENFKVEREKMTMLRTETEGFKKRLRQQIDELAEKIPEEVKSKEEIEIHLAELQRKCEEYRQTEKRLDFEEAENTNIVTRNTATIETLLATLSMQEKQQDEARRFYQTKLDSSLLTEEEFLNLIQELPKKSTLESDIKGFDLLRNDTVSRKNQLQAELALLAEEESDEDELIQLKKTTEQRVDSLLRDFVDAENKVKVSQHTLINLEKLRSENAELAGQYDLVSSLAELANGGKGGLQGVTFERFVLGAILEDVATAANLQLRKMSRGRYELQRAEVGATGRGNKGLDLEVYDSYTGYCRAAGTLSGGETFLASMSLALGLADVVQSYSGGIRLDTIFVDEGFGTLDPETLDVALEALVSLQESGRLVGVISHVPEMQQRIHTQLTVTKKEQGSDARFTFFS